MAVFYLHVLPRMTLGSPNRHGDEEAMTVLAISLISTAPVAPLAFVPRPEYAMTWEVGREGQIGAKDNAVKFFIGLVDPRLNYALMWFIIIKKWKEMESKVNVPRANDTAISPPRADNVHRLLCRHRSLDLERPGRDDPLRYIADQKSSSSWLAAPGTDRFTRTSADAAYMRSLGA